MASEDQLEGLLGDGGSLGEELDPGTGAEILSEDHSVGEGAEGDTVFGGKPIGSAARGHRLAELVDDLRIVSSAGVPFEIREDVPDRGGSPDLRIDPPCRGEIDHEIQSIIMIVLQRDKQGWMNIEINHP